MNECFLTTCVSALSPFSRRVERLERFELLEPPHTRQVSAAIALDEAGAAGFLSLHRQLWPQKTDAETRGGIESSTFRSVLGQIDHYRV
jgi:hypothetical protein